MGFLAEDKMSFDAEKKASWRGNGFPIFILRVILHVKKCRRIGIIFQSTTFKKLFSLIAVHLSRIPSWTQFLLLSLVRNLVKKLGQIGKLHHDLHATIVSS